MDNVMETNKKPIPQLIPANSFMIKLLCPECGKELVEVEKPNFDIDKLAMTYNLECPNCKIKIKSPFAPNQVAHTHLSVDYASGDIRNKINNSKVYD